jgi:hypothetical protein
MANLLNGLLALGGSLLLLSCGARAKDTVHPAACTRDPAPLVVVDDAALTAAVRRATYLVRGRVRFTGNAVNYDGDKQLRYVYIIVDTLEYLKGDPWQVPERYRKSFPLLALESGRSESPHFASEPAALATIEALSCREDEALWFALDLPSPHSRPLHEVPDPVRRSFGPLDVGLHAVVAETERDRLVEALSR